MGTTLQVLHCGYIREGVSQGRPLLSLNNLYWMGRLSSTSIVCCGVIPSLSTVVVHFVHSCGALGAQLWYTWSTVVVHFNQDRQLLLQHNLHCGSHLVLHLVTSAHFGKSLLQDLTAPSLTETSLTFKRRAALPVCCFKRLLWLLVQPCSAQRQF